MSDTILSLAARADLRDIERLVKAVAPQSAGAGRTHQDKAVIAFRLYNQLRQKKVPGSAQVEQIAAHLGLPADQTLIGKYVALGHKIETARASNLPGTKRAADATFANTHGGQQGSGNKIALPAAAAKRLKQLQNVDEPSPEEEQEFDGLMDWSRGRNTPEAQAVQEQFGGGAKPAAAKPATPPAETPAPAAASAPAPEAASAPEASSAPTDEDATDASAAPNAESAPAAADAPAEDDDASLSGGDAEHPPAADPGEEEQAAPQAGGGAPAADEDDQQGAPQQDPDMLAAEMGGGEEEPPKPARKPRKPKRDPNAVPQGAVEVPTQAEEPSYANQDSPENTGVGSPYSHVPRKYEDEEDQLAPEAAEPEGEAPAAETAPEASAPAEAEEAPAKKPRRRRVAKPAPEEEQFTPAGENGGPVTATGAIEGDAGGTHRHQGLAVQTEKGPNGGFYQITQNGNRRRISQREYAERQGKNNKPRHLSELGPGEERNGPLDGYTRWNEAEQHGLPKFHSSRVTANTHHKTGEAIDEVTGREAMHPADANREEYMEIQEQQRAERRAAREADKEITRVANSYDRPNTPKGHFQGKKNLKLDDVRAHIRALSEFSGLEGGVGHRMSWVVDPQHTIIYVNGKRYKKRKNEGGGRAIDFDTTTNDDGSVTVQAKLLTYAPTKKHLSPKQIAYLIATGQIHPVNQRHDPESVNDFGQAVTLSAEDLKSGNMKSLNNLMSYCAEYSHNQRGARVNRQLHNLFEAHGATHHNWRYDKMFETSMRGGTGAHASGRAGGGSYEAQGQGQAYAASFRATQLATYLGPDWQEKVAEAARLAKSGVAVQLTEVNGERFLHNPLMLTKGLASGTGLRSRASRVTRVRKSVAARAENAFMRDGYERVFNAVYNNGGILPGDAVRTLGYSLLATSRGPERPYMPGAAETYREAPPPPPPTKGQTATPPDPKAPKRLRKPRRKVSDTFYNGGDLTNIPPQSALDGTRPIGGYRPKVLAALCAANSEGHWEQMVRTHRWTLGYIRTTDIHGVGIDETTCDPAKIQRYCEAITRGETMPPIIAIRQGDSYHILDGRHRLLGADRAGKLTIWAYLGTPTMGAVGYQTS